MVLPNETLCGPGGTHELHCEDCNELLTLKVCRSAAGYYVGTWCKCGPNSRESGYYRTPGEAEEALKTGNFGR
jgi:hypothetical protein